MLKPTCLAAGLIVAAGLGAGPARAQGELDRPYDLQIVVHVADHRLLTDVFRERVTRELRDSLQAELGDLARVSVVQQHPRLREVLDRGLERALDGWVEHTGIKTHFVLIDYAGGQYEIQARQYDGLIGRPSRAVRRDRTRDHDFVAKAAALLVAHDFGVLGTVAGPPDEREQVKVDLKAGALGSLARWVPKNHVFEVVPPGSTAALEWALLQVVEPPSEQAPGTCVCKFWHRYTVGNIVGDRCMLLGTTRAPLRLRFMQERPRGGRAALDTTLGVDIRRSGFSGEDTTKLHQTTDSPGVPRGWVDTSREGDKGVFEGVAFVSVTNGLKPPLPHIPVAVVDDRPVIIPVRVTEEAGGLFASRLATWQRNVNDSLLVQINLFREIQELAAKADGQALEKARAGLRRTGQDLEGLRAERAELAQEAARAKVPFNPVREDQRLRELAEGENQLKRFLTEQEKINLVENDPKKREWAKQVEQARLLEDAADVHKALPIYERVLREGLQNDDLKKHVAELKKQWEPVDDQHKWARAFIYNIWPTLNTPGLKEHMAEAQKAFEECKRVKDTLGPRKLFKATEAHVLRLGKELDELKPDINLDDQRPAQLIKEISPDLQKLAGAILLYLQQSQPPGS
jgi:hypothetical protein